MRASTKLLQPDNTERSIGDAQKTRTKLEVWSVDDCQKMIPSRVTRFMNPEFKDAFRVTLESGTSIETVRNSRLLTATGWKTVEALTPNISVAKPSTTVRALAEHLPNFFTMHEHAVNVMVRDEAWDLLQKAKKAEPKSIHIDWDKIVSVEPVGLHSMFDVEVTDHNLVANGIIIQTPHNHALRILGKM